MIDYRPGHDSGSWQSCMRTAWAVAFDLMGTPVEPRVPYRLASRSYLDHPVPEKDDGSGRGSLYPLPPVLPRRSVIHDNPTTSTCEGQSTITATGWPRRESGPTGRRQVDSGRERPIEVVVGRPTNFSEEGPARCVQDRLGHRVSRRRSGSRREGGSRTLRRERSIGPAREGRLTSSRRSVRESTTPGRATYHGVIKRVKDRRRRANFGDVWIGTHETVQHFCERYGLKDPTPPSVEAGGDREGIRSTRLCATAATVKGPTNDRLPDVECGGESEIRVELEEDDSDEGRDTSGRTLKERVRERQRERTAEEKVRDARLERERQARWRRTRSEADTQSDAYKAEYGDPTIGWSYVDEYGTRSGPPLDGGEMVTRRMAFDRYMDKGGRLPCGWDPKTHAWRAQFFEM